VAFPTGWLYRCPITIAAGKVSDTLTHWPLLLTGANLPASIFTDANADGSDIRASSDEAGTTELAVEVVSFTPGSSTAEIWVKVPSVSAVADTVIYLWFGNAAATMPAADSAFGSQAVWIGEVSIGPAYHFGGGSLSLADSSAAGATLTNNGTTAGDGPFGTAVVLSASVKQWLTSSASLNGYDGFTISWWEKSSINLQECARISFDAATARFIIQDKSNHAPVYADGDVWAADTTVLLDDGDWHYYALTVSDATSGTWTFYRDGSPIKTATRSWTPGGNQLAIGNHYGITPVLKLAASLDEIRVCNGGRSPAWIAADYASQVSPGTFATAGAVTTITLNPVKVLFLNVSGTIKVVLTQAE